MSKTKHLLTMRAPGFFLCLVWATLFAPQVLMAEEKLHVAASILPQKYFIQKIGDGRVDVSIMVLPGANPATYEPKPRQMVSLSKADIYFAIGVPFENHWLPRFAETNPRMKIVETQGGITKIPMQSDGMAHPEDLVPSKQHPHGTEDPHIWLSPPLVMVQARNILNALVGADPTNRDFYEKNYNAFIAELKWLDNEIRETLEGIAPNTRFMVYHPSWGYFASTYGLEQIPIELEGKEPSPRKLLELIKKTRKEKIRVIFVQPQFSEKSAKTIASAIDGEVMFADPLALDWKENLIKVAQALNSALSAPQ